MVKGELNPYVTQAQFDVMWKMIHTKTSPARRKELREIAKRADEGSNIEIIDWEPKPEKYRQER